MVEHLDASKHKIYQESIEYFESYALINYQSISIVDFNILDDNMIYKIGILMYRSSDNQIFEIHPHSDKEKQILKILNKN